VPEERREPVLDCQFGQSPALGGVWPSGEHVKDLRAREPWSRRRLRNLPRSVPRRAAAAIASDARRPPTP
jgi:hypothetical protein